MLAWVSPKKEGLGAGVLHLEVHEEVKKMQGPINERNKIEVV